MELAVLFAVNAVVIAGLMMGVWLVSVFMRDVSLVDIAWGLGFVGIAWGSASYRPEWSSRAWLSGVLATVWGLRLSCYLAWRNLGRPEDYRYRAMRERFGDRFWIISLVVVFGVQGVVMWIVSLPLQMAPQSPSPLHGLDLFGLALWTVGFVFEAVGDFQLARFRSRQANRGRICDQGLWRYTRHPNYFGDFLVWWGFFCIAAAGGAWWTIVSPLLMSVLLLRISGVALLEKSLKARSPEYTAYMERTSAFFPWPPRT